MAGDKMMYQIKVTLNGIRPPVWRRLLVPSSLSLKDLHDILQVAIGWTDSHLHQFVAKGTFYGEPDPEFEMERLDETRVRVDEVLRKEKDAMTYEYDFGDGWEHKIVLEKVLANPEASFAPSCIAGARACPPEDCGGVWGYANLLEIISDFSHPEHEEMLEWLGDAFDPGRFDMPETNSILARMKRRGLTKRPTRTRAKAARAGGRGR
jgi:hypothetical protein